MLGMDCIFQNWATWKKKISNLKNFFGSIQAKKMFFIFLKPRRVEDDRTMTWRKKVKIERSNFSGIFFSSGRCLFPENEVLSHLSVLIEIFGNKKFYLFSHPRKSAVIESYNVGVKSSRAGASNNCIKTATIANNWKYNAILKSGTSCMVCWQVWPFVILKI